MQMTAAHSAVQVEDLLPAQEQNLWADSLKTFVNQNAVNSHLKLTVSV